MVNNRQWPLSRFDEYIGISIFNEIRVNMQTRIKMSCFFLNTNSMIDYHN